MDGLRSTNGTPPGTSTGTVRVLVAEDDEALREGTRNVLSGTGDVEVVGLAANPVELDACIAETAPAVVVLDIRMPPTYRMEGIEAARRIRAEHPRMGVVILSQHADPEYALEFLRDGSAGRAYLLKERLGDPAQLVDAIREVATGGSVLDPKVVDGLLEAQRRRAHSRLQGLTEGEHEVLGLMASGRSNVAIAAEVGTSVRAVEADAAAIYRKLGLPTTITTGHRVGTLACFLARALD